ncbi:glycosyltransferase family 9 protein, partial [Vibrio anguillarum]
EAVDLLAACHTVISNDSGLMHVSAAVDCNIVAIYGSSSPQYTPPLTERLEMVYTDIECRPCFKRTCPLGHLNCLNQLQPVQVIQALDRFIGKDS